MCVNLNSLIITSPLKNIEAGAFDGCEKLQGFTIPTKVTSIEPSTFTSTGLKSITIHSGIKSIGEDAFAGCKDLSSVKTYTGLTIISDRAFYACPVLEDISIPSSVTEIGTLAFSKCDQLESVEVFWKSKEELAKVDGFAFPNSFMKKATEKKYITIPKGTLDIYEKSYNNWNLYNVKEKE